MSYSPNQELYPLIENAQFTYGNHHGKNRLNLKINPVKFELGEYLIPIEPNRVYLVKSAPLDIKEKVSRLYSLDDFYYKKSGLITIYSYLLYYFLKTFYIYKKENLLKFPLSKEVRDWEIKRVDLAKAVIIPMLLTDGGEKPGNRLCIAGASDIVHELMADAFFKKFNMLPSSYKVKVKHKTIFVTTFNMNKDNLSSLKEICPTFKTSPYNQNTNVYLNGLQPSIKFLFNASKIEQQTAIRIWAITEGSIGIRLDKKTKLIMPVLQIACAHPGLVIELKEICTQNGMNFYIIKEKKNWKGISGLKSGSLRTTISFFRIGGFIRGVNICSNSPFFEGLDKQDVLLGILEFVIKQRVNKEYRIENKNKVYKYIQTIVKNKKFKSEKYYLKTFENFNNWTFR